MIDDVRRTTRVLERMLGLLAMAPLEHGQGLLIAPCASVHTCFMRDSIDVVYLDRSLRVRKLVRALAPWRVSGCAGAAMTLEMRAGAIDSTGLALHQQLQWEMQ